MPPRSAPSVFHGRLRWSRDRGARLGPPSPRAERRRSTAWRSTSPAARTTHNTHGVPATAYSTMWRSPRGSCKAKPRAGDACLRSQSSTLTCTRAMALHRSLTAMRRCSRSRFTRPRTSRSASRPAPWTSRCRMAPATMPTLRHCATASRQCGWRFEPQLLIYVSGADAHEGDRLGKLKLSTAGMQARDRTIFDFAEALGVPVAVTMAGGYGRDVATTVGVHFSTVQCAWQSWLRRSGRAVSAIGAFAADAPAQDASPASRIG